MKKLITLCIAAIPMMTYAQTGRFMLEGKVEQTKLPVKIYLETEKGGKLYTDSTTLQNGKFEFNGAITDPIQVKLVLKHDLSDQHRNVRHPDVLMVYLDATRIEIHTVDSIKNALIKGSVINDDYRKLQDDLKLIDLAQAKWFKESMDATEETRKSVVFQNSMKQQAQRLIFVDRQAVIINYIKNNPGSFISLIAFRTISSDGSTDGTILSELFDTLSPQVRSTATGKAFAIYVKKMKISSVGSLAPDFVQADTSGNPVRLSSFRGKYLLLDFWASWCSPCREENPNYVKAYTLYHTKGFEILGVSLDRPGNKDSWIKAIQDDQLSWKQVSDLKFWKNDAAMLYGIQSVPQNFLIDPEGKIIARNLRELTWKRSSNLFTIIKNNGI